MKNKKTMPTVEYEGKTYSLTSRKTIIPDLYSMEALEAKLWIMQNTRPSGKRKDSVQRLPQY